MKIIQSFWSGNQKEFTNSYGWYSYKHNWLSWILSCHQLVKYHDKVELYTDSFGYEVLIEKLKLPYTKVYVVLDELNQYHKDLWAIAKVRTFQLQNEPFLHVDGDVFVWESLTNKFNDSNLVTQNLEITTDYYRNNWDIIHPNLEFLPVEMEGFHNYAGNFACNMGIIGGNNIAFFKEYCKKSIDFVSKNKAVWNRVITLNFNVFFEQVLFYEFANQTNEKIDFLFLDIPKDNEYKGFGDFDKIPHKTYLHLLGVYKSNAFVCKTMEVYIMKHYPESYTKLARIINGVNKNNKEIDYLTPKIINELILDYEINLKNNSLKSNKLLLNRDLFNEGAPNKLDFFLEKATNFMIVSLSSFEKKNVVQNDELINFLEIEELNSIARLYDLDQIDEIMLEELKNPIEYSDFISKMANYLDDEDENSNQFFLELINNRLRNYLILKIISIYSIN